MEHPEVKAVARVDYERPKPDRKSEKDEGAKSE